HDELHVPAEEQAAFKLSKAIVKAKLPNCDWYLITTFFFPPIRKKRTSLHPPILRDAILNARVPEGDGEHVLVYQTSDTFSELLPTLKRLPGRFIVYGLKRDQELGNVTLKDFSEDGFVRDLASARAVLAGGGFSLMGEAVQLGKPLLSVPLEGQFEQTLNALYLQKLNYGEYHRELSEKAIHEFLERAPEYSKSLQEYAYRGDHNRSILHALDELVERIGREGRLVSRGAESDEPEDEEADA